ncbi:hypothetical protein NP061_007370 [Weissella confusa]|uniref:Uncharacterized protein n=3 Tax=Limosilactobacillus reuteri TaxID=1598 RepID=A0A2T5Q2H0_LIMRT|nr:hypothetical protein [Limosilactobacillus reuteri]MCW3764187.1 hypothetical protein [Weissella confusa]PTV03438.1 hypothetical protein DB325_07445 [Limosilactobacillus reuteri]
MGKTNNLKYIEETSPQVLIDVLNSDLEQTAKQYNSFCQLINDRLAINNSLHYNHSPIDPGFNRKTRLDLIKNIRDLN